MSELKPCPFCRVGCLAVMDTGGCEVSWQVSCSCGAYGPSLTYPQDEELAVECWNTRIDNENKDSSELKEE